MGLLSSVILTVLLISLHVVDRRPMMVLLLRNITTGTPSEGIYYCVVADDTFINQTVYVGLYNNGGICTCIASITCKLTCTCVIQF